MNDLSCALCLHEQARKTSDRLLPKPAVTVANGHALCETHFVSTHDLVDSSGGGAALAFLKRAQSL